MTLTLPLPPALNDVYRPNFGNRKGVRKTAEAQDWELAAQWLAKAAKWEPLEGPVVMVVQIFYKTERDIDSSQKILQDCLQGCGYTDDRQIKKLIVEKFKDNANPRLEVRVEGMISG